MEKPNDAYFQRYLVIKAEMVSNEPAFMRDGHLYFREFMPLLDQLFADYAHQKEEEKARPKPAPVKSSPPPKKPSFKKR